jgi:CheY-like chemotaxis protein
LRRDRGFDALICDLMMPDVDGIAVYEALVEGDPELAGRLAFLTGGAFTDRAAHFARTTAVPLVRKPASRQELLAVVAMLRASGASRH